MREKFIFESIDKGGKGLEIGPSYNPLAPKSAGWNIEIADHLEAEGLREKYKAWNVDTSKIEDVDYVISGSSLFDVIKKPGEYDFIIASHVIEHTTDMVAFLQDCQKLLKPGGVLSLAIPDKRFCFDVFKPITTTGVILQAHFERRTRHSSGQFFDQYAYHTMRGNSLVWFDRELEGAHLVHTIRDAYDRMRRYAESNHFEDVHAWMFTPSSFHLLVQDLNELELVKMGIVALSDTFGFEFFATLKKSNPGKIVDRIELLKKLDTEIRH